jgi:hypothetical protein
MWLRSSLMVVARRRRRRVLPVEVWLVPLSLWIM